MDITSKTIIILSVIILLLVIFLIYRKISASKKSDENVRGEKLHLSIEGDNYDELADIIIEGIGGLGNITDMKRDNSRLKFTINDYTAVDEKRIKEAQVSAVLRPSKTTVHIIAGAGIDGLADTLEKKIN